MIIERLLFYTLFSNYHLVYIATVDFIPDQRPIISAM